MSVKKQDVLPVFEGRSIFVKVVFADQVREVLTAHCSGKFSDGKDRRHSIWPNDVAHEFILDRDVNVGTAQQAVLNDPRWEAALKG